MGLDMLLESRREGGQRDLSGGLSAGLPFDPTFLLSYLDPPRHEMQFIPLRGVIHS